MKKLIAKSINNGFVKSKYDSTNDSRDDSTDDMENSLLSRDCKDENILRLEVKSVAVQNVTTPASGTPFFVVPVDVETQGYRVSTSQFVD